MKIPSHTSAKVLIGEMGIQSTIFRMIHTIHWGQTFDQVNLSHVALVEKAIQALINSNTAES